MIVDTAWLPARSGRADLGAPRLSTTRGRVAVVDHARGSRCRTTGRKSSINNLKLADADRAGSVESLIKHHQNALRM